MRQRAYIIWVLFFSLTSTSRSQDTNPFDKGAAGLLRALKRLQTTASILHVVAHPDDEDGPLLAYCARGLGIRTMLFSITRGEGGANLIAPYFFDELGALRTLEHAKSADFYGNELFYSHAADYGYSKTLDEANRQWNDGKPILADLVEVIRRERPTIIASRFRGDSRDGHGHHQMAGVISQSAFEAADNDSHFSDQLDRGIDTWAVQKLYANNIRPEWRTEDRDAWTVAIPTGDYDALLGRSYAQVARYGLGFQRSQGISGHIGPAGPRESYYRLLRARGMTKKRREDSMLDGLDTSITGLTKYASQSPAWLEKSLDEIQRHATAALQEFRFQATDKLISSLTHGLKMTKELDERLESASEEIPSPSRTMVREAVRRKVTEFEDALSKALAVDLDVWATLSTGDSSARFFGGRETGFWHATPGCSFVTNVRLVHRSPFPVELMDVQLDVPASWSAETIRIGPSTLQPNNVTEFTSRVRMNRNAPATKPYWRRNSISDPFYDVDPSSHRQAPLPRPPAAVRVTLAKDGVEFTVRRFVDIRMRHPEYGQVRYPLTVVPAVSVRFPLTHGIVPLGNDTYSLDVIARNDMVNGAEFDVRLQLPTGWACEPTEHRCRIEKEGEEKKLVFQLSLPAATGPGKFTISASAQFKGQSYSDGFRTISARDLGRVNLYRSARHQVRLADVQLSGTPNVGYVMGSGDDIPQALSMIGIRPTMLSGNDLADVDFSSFDVILIGVRAYAVRPDVRKHNSRLLDYVHQGGVLVVQYQTPEFDENFGPFPYQMGRRPEEVSEEDAKVTILEPDHVLFHKPNRIGPSDFDDWIEQRGSKFWKSWDSRYTPLLECHDTGQTAQEGGMLIAKYGQGVYIYSAYAWYRQLPHGVSGAFRLYANMLSLPKTVSE